MGYTVKDYQSRVNGIMGHELLLVDGMKGPKTREGIKDAIAVKGVCNEEQLFTRGVRGVVWHWTAGAYGIIAFERKHYNSLFDRDGNTYDGGATVQEQVNYDWRSGVGVSHTRSMNTGWLGASVDAMAGAQEAPFKWGTNPLTWEGIDAMLEWTMEMCEEYDIPVSPWTTLSHAEVQTNLRIPQKWKWDYKVLPDSVRAENPRLIGDKMRKRMLSL